MEVIVLGRGRGKTMRLLQWVLAAPEGEHRIIVSATRDESHRLFRKNHDDYRLPLESWQFCSLAEVLEPPNGAWSGVLMGRGGRIVLGLDNLDLMLSQLFQYWPVGAITITQRNY